MCVSHTIHLATLFYKSTKMHLLWEQGVAGSNPATSTINLKASFIEAFLFCKLKYEKVLTYSIIIDS